MNKFLKSTLPGLVLLLSLGLSVSANAALINFTGNITFHNDVIYTYFTLNDDATDVRVWTDSFQAVGGSGPGTNFDPITALWDSAGNLIDENDDNDNVDPATQTYFDSGFILPTLAAGEYLFTVAAYPNFVEGSNLSDGFRLDSDTPILISDWSQPANGGNLGGSFWSVWLDGVDSATNPGGGGQGGGEPGSSVPEPAALFLLGLGLAGFGFSRRKKNLK